MDLCRRLPDEEEATGNENDIAPGECGFESDFAMIARRTGYAEVEYRRCQPDDPGNCREQRKSQKERETDADAPRGGSLLFGKLVREDRDENEIVDTKNNFENNQGSERRPCLWRCEHCKIISQLFPPVV